MDLKKRPGLVLAAALATSTVAGFGGGMAYQSATTTNSHETFEVDMLSQDKSIIRNLLSTNKYDPRVTQAYAQMVDGLTLGTRVVPQSTTKQQDMPGIIDASLTSMLNDSKRQIRQERYTGEAEFLVTPTARAVDEMTYKIEKIYGRAVQPGILLAPDIGSVQSLQMVVPKNATVTFPKLAAPKTT
jgi:hypothetical protein